MNSSIPLPTDNIYKFYALFGLVVLVSCLMGDIYLLNAALDRAYTTRLELESLKSKDNLTKEEEIKKKALDDRKDIVMAEQRVFHGGLFIGMLIGTIMMLYGFFKWHNDVQPAQDKLLKLQIEKLEKEIATLNKN